MPHVVQDSVPIKHQLHVCDPNCDGKFIVGRDYRCELPQSFINLIIRVQTPDLHEINGYSYRPTVHITAEDGHDLGKNIFVMYTTHRVLYITLHTSSVAHSFLLCTRGLFLVMGHNGVLNSFWDNRPCKFCTCSKFM